MLQEKKTDFSMPSDHVFHEPMKKISAGLVMVVLLCGCAGPAVYNHAGPVVEAESSKPGVILDAEAEREAIGRFGAFFADVSVESVRSQIDAFYAPDVYFNDTLKTLRGREAVKASTDDLLVCICEFKKFNRTTDLWLLRNVDRWRGVPSDTSRQC